MARGKAANAPAVFTLLKAAFIGCVVSVALIVIFCGADVETGGRRGTDTDC